MEGERLPLKCIECKNKNACKYPKDYEDYEYTIISQLNEIRVGLTHKSKDIFYININCKYFEELGKEKNDDK